MFDRAGLGHADAWPMPHPLQLARIAWELCDVLVFRPPPVVVVWCATFSVLAAMAR